jgi:hypothetical protein
LYTVDTLPPASSATGYVAFVTDLGGGADNVISDGAFWKHIRRGKFLATGPAPTFSIVALKSPTVVIVTGTINLSMQFVLQPVNLYPGYELTVKRTNPLSTLIGSLGALSIKAPNGVTLSIADQSVDLQWSGTEFIQIRP